ncbi:multiple epidermal growth factor-like domains protein 10 [Saccostrea cucullata]|uniref:multiple epidermal growth factor-like domains protein 10 n=1 Tax=Saccostrea cuccullata TaxID=36930 RepID=UPI002ED131B5
MTGSCPSGLCERGWKNASDKRCNEECDNGTFGLHCRSKCSGHCAGGLSCNKVTGSCPEGCEDGWINSYCNETCRNNFYGENCSFPCGHCANNAKCDHVTGSCPFGLCKRGWKNTSEKRCNEECENGTFGSNCQSKCSGHCAGEIPCNKVDGFCTQGCAVGWINPYCNDTCQTNFYGKNCSCSCGHCANNATCDHVTGSCPSGLCKRGWKKNSDKRCDEECENGTFGSNCQSKCSGHCVGGLPCNKVDGLCTEGCAFGWINPYCNDTIKRASECNSNQLVRSSLYGTIAALFLSILLNIFLIVRNAKKAFYMRQRSKKGNKEQDSTIETYVTVPGRIEENTAYQELTVQLNNSWINDTEESNAGYQELGQSSQPSHYEELKQF